MIFHKILFVGMILFLVVLGFFCMHFSKTNDVLQEYNQFGFLQSNIRYQQVEKSWGQQGLIFYQVEFPDLNMPHQIEQMFLKMNCQGMNLHLKNVHFNVKEALNKKYDSSMADQLNQYVPYQDFFNRFLTSLSVLGTDEFVGDILMNTTYSDLKTIHFDIQVNQKQQKTLKMTGILHIPMVNLPHLSHLWQGDLTEFQVEVQDENLLQRYINYAKSRKIKLPENWHGSILYMKNLSQKLPKIQNILK